MSSQSRAENNPAFQLAQLTVFERAKAKRRMGKKGEKPQSLLEKFQSLRGAEKTRFFRENKAALKFAEAEIRSAS